MGPERALTPIRAALGLTRRHPDALALLLIGGVAALLRLAFLYRVPVILTGDSQSHYLPGYDLAFGLPIDPDLRRPPGYAALVAGTIWVFGEELRAVALVQHALGVGSALLTYLLGRLTFGRAAGLGAGLLVALNGALVLSGQSIMTETLFTALLLATLAALLLAGRTGHWAWAIVAGLALGSASLTRPVAQLLVLVVPLAFVVGRRIDGRAARNLPTLFRPMLRGSVLVGIGALMVMVPWMARNYVEHGTFTAAGGLGRSLIARTIKYDEGFFTRSYEVAEGDTRGEARQFIRGKRNTIRNSRTVRSTQAGLMKEMNLTQAESDRLMRQVATDEIMTRPGYYLAGSLQMAWQIVLGKEKEDTYSDRWLMRRDKDWVEQWEARVDHLLAPSTPAEEMSVEAAQRLTNLFQPATLGPILPALAGLGLVLAAVGCRPALVPGLAGLGILLASAALDGPVPRYRYPLDPLLALLAAGALTLAAGWLFRVLRRRALVPTPARPARSAGPVAEASR